MTLLKKFFLYTVLLVFALVAASASGLWWWLHRPLAQAQTGVEFVVPAGSGPVAVARSLREAGVVVPERLFALAARLTGQDTQLKAGAYVLKPGETLLTLLDRISRGDMLQRQIVLLEGWTWRQIRAALAAHPDLRQTLDQVDDQAILASLGASEDHLEGLFFPDTYRFVPGTTDLALLNMAYQAQQRELDLAWAARTPDLPLNSPYEALVLASIIEKETGHGPERARISGVFVNRLRLGMPLQTDPTVIYGMGQAYDGRVRKRDLQTDTPWNTYTRRGLPPTPIAAPGRAALMAAVQPERHRYLYFVSRGDGSSEFAGNLSEHNRNVRQYILGKN